MIKYKTIDQHFFDTAGKSPDDLKRVYYLLGAFYPGYIPYGGSGL